MILHAFSSLPGAPSMLPLMSILLHALYELKTSSRVRGDEHGHAVWPQMLASLSLALSYRLCLAAATSFHEIAHLVAMTMLTGSLSAFSGQNRIFHISPRLWAKCICPFLPWPAEAQPHVCATSSLSRSGRAFVRLSGAAASLCLAVAASLFLPFSMSAGGQTISTCIVASSWMVAAGAFATDVLCLGVDSSSSSFRCGNFGMLVISLLDRLDLDVPAVLRSMAATTAARGGQSGGLVTVLPDGSSLRERCVPSKRADVAKLLVKRFMWRSWSRKLLSRGKQSPCSFYLGHTRFATSSAPTVPECHPHRFSPAKKVRVWRRGANGWAATSENFEVYVTHNGDLDYWPLFGVQRTQRELGAWLSKVLDVKSKVVGCDSVKVAGIIELLRTQGIWHSSLRLAYQHTKSPSFDATVLEGSISPALLDAAAKICDKEFGDFACQQQIRIKDECDVAMLSAHMAGALSQIPELARLFPMGSGLPSIGDLSHKACRNFLENDLFTALSRFLADAHGSFGIAACCTIDRNTTCIASRGQAMCMSFSPSTGAVLWGSESAAQDVELLSSRASPATPKTAAVPPGQLGAAARLEVDVEAAGSGIASAPRLSTRPAYRHDLDESEGEVIEISVHKDADERLAAEEACDAPGCGTQREFDSSCGSGRFVPFPELPSLRLRVLRFRPHMRCVKREEFMADESMIDMSKVISTASPFSGTRDKVLGDLKDIPRVLSLIQEDWRDSCGLNRRTGSQFYSMLEQLVSERASGAAGRLEVDVLVTAVEASLWIGEQFASDLQGLFPSLRVVPVSANKVIGVLSNDRGSAPMTGFSFCSLTMSLKRTMVVAISHSGQTFPTLHATHSLRRICGNRVFVLTGSVDSKMAAAVGQMPQKDAPWIGRVWHTFCGWRPSEALTVSTVACHQSLSELLLYLAKRASKSNDEGFRASSGMKLSSADIQDLGRLNGCIVDAAIEAVAVDRDGLALPSKHHDALVHEGRRWALHILEAPLAWILSSAYIFASVVSGYPVFFSIVNVGILPVVYEDFLPSVWATKLVLVVDSLLYCFLPLFFCMILRLVQGRQLFARLGKRTLVIGDVPFVHQLLESYVSKLFSLSYSIASIDVHGANVIDHLVHRFTHRVARGVLIASGRPDGRLFSMIKAESWVLMALQQCKAIVHFVAPPELLTVGHNPYSNPSVVDAHISIPSMRPKFMSELLSGVSHEEPMQRLAAIKQANLAEDSEKVLSEFNRGNPIGVLALDNLTEAQERQLAIDMDNRMHRAAEVAFIEGRFDHSIRSNFEISRHSYAAASMAGVDGSHRTRISSASAAIIDGSRHGAGITGTVMSLFSGVEGSRHSAYRVGERSHHEASKHSTGPRRHDGSKHSAIAQKEGSRHSVLGEAFTNVGLGSRLAAAAQHPEAAHDHHAANGDDERISISAIAGPGAVDRAMSGMPDNLVRILNKGSVVELWYENRYASLERYLSFLVLFHAMADRVASFMPLHFEIWRSQSQLRVATTAAPISAAEVEKEWASDKHHIECFPLVDHASRDPSLGV